MVDIKSQVYLPPVVNCGFIAGWEGFAGKFVTTDSGEEGITVISIYLVRMFGFNWNLFVLFTD